MTEFRKSILEFESTTLETIEQKIWQDLRIIMEKKYQNRLEAMKDIAKVSIQADNLVKARVALSKIE